MKKLCWRFIPFLIFFSLAFFLWRGLALNPQTLPSVLLGKTLPQFKLPWLGEKKFVSQSAMRGQIYLLNVWSSWCEACVEEQVFLMRLAREGVAIFGLNYKDKTDDALNWLARWGNPYQAIGEDKEGKVAINLGVYGAPETFLIDKNGIVQYKHIGILDENSWNEEFLPRMKQLQNQG